MSGVHIAQVTRLDLDVRLTIGFGLGAKLLGYSGFADCGEDGGNQVSSYGLMPSVLRWGCCLYE